MDAVGAELIAGLLAVSASADLASRRIPNLLPVCIAATGFVYAVSQGARAAVVTLAIGVLVAAVLVLAWSARVLGGGDVKLATASVLCLGPERVGHFLAATAIAGGALSLVAAAFAYASRQAAAVETVAVATTAGPMRPSVVRSVTVPYGAAIAVGAIYALAR